MSKGNFGRKKQEGGDAKPTMEEAKAKLDELIGAIETGLDEGGEEAEPTLVPMSPVPTLQADALSMGKAAAVAANKRLREEKPAVGAQFDAINAALAHRDKIVTPNTLVGVGNSVVQIPADARDKANRLYYIFDARGKQHYRPEKAAKLMRAALTDDVAERVMQVAAAQGYDRKPLVWFSQKVWERINLGGKHDFSDVKDESLGFNKGADDEESKSPFVTLLNAIFDHLSARQICRLAEQNDIGVLDVLRSFATAMCDACEPKSEAICRR